MKERILVLLMLGVLLSWTTTHASESGSEKELDEVYSEILCVGCGGKKTIDHSRDCLIARDLRAKTRSLVEKGFDKDEIIYNFNQGNIAFIHQLPATAIRNLDCPCACKEKIWVCLAGENECPVIESVVGDIRRLKEQGESADRIIELLKSNEYQERYLLIIEASINMAHQMQDYYISDLPDFVLDNTICTCECTEALRTCIEKMPWCKRINLMISESRIYLYIMKLSPQDVVSAIYAPCAKICAKKTGGKYSGKNCFVCQRPVTDMAYYREVDGKEEVFCCRSCYEMGSPLPQDILDKVECKICSCRVALSKCKEEYCPLISVEKKLIKSWLLQGMTQDEVIMKLR